MAFHVFIKHATQQSPGPEQGSHVTTVQVRTVQQFCGHKGATEEQYKFSSMAAKQVSVLNGLSILLSLLLRSKAASPRT